MLQTGQSQALLMLAGSAKLLEPGSASSTAHMGQQFQQQAPFFSHGVAPRQRERQRVPASIESRSHSSHSAPIDTIGGGAAKARASETARTLRKQDIVKYFHLTVAEAARQFGLGRTCFKSVCRREGIHEWPRPTRVIRRPNLRPVKRARLDPVECGPLSQISNYIGVFWNQHDNKWQAQITHEHHTEHLGSFADDQGGEVEAARAFDAAARLKRRQQMHSSPESQTRWVLNFPSEEDRRYDVESAARAQQGHQLLQPQYESHKGAAHGRTGGNQQTDDLPGVEALALLAALHKTATASASDPAVKPEVDDEYQQAQHHQQQLQHQLQQHLQSQHQLAASSSYTNGMTQQQQQAAQFGAQALDAAARKHEL